MESQETDAPGVSPMNKKGPPPGEQQKKKTTFKVIFDFVLFAALYSRSQYRFAISFIATCAQTEC